MTRTDTVRRLARVTTIVATVALLVSIVPSSVSAAPATACKVANLDSGEVHGSLQQAVRAATAGNRLKVQGECVGTTVVDKDVRIGGRRIAISSMVCDERGCRRTGQRDSGPPTIRSGGRGPALIIDAAVDDLLIGRRVAVKPGLVIADAAAWRSAWANVPDVTVRPMLHVACRVRNVDSSGRFGALPPAVRAAAPDDRLTLQGRCGRTSYIRDDLGIFGVRTKYDRRRPTIGVPRRGVALSVDAAVDEFVLRGIVLRGGLRITG